MGKGTIVSHKGDGLYSVRLRKSTRHVTDRIADIDAELVDVDAGIVSAVSRVDEAAAQLAARRSDIDGEILSINAKYADLGEAIRKGREDLKDAEDSVRVAQEMLDWLLDAQAEDEESVNDMQIADATAAVATAEATRDAIQTKLDEDTEAWSQRSSDLDRLNALIVEAATVEEAVRAAESVLGDLVNKRSQLMADRAWLSGKMPVDDLVDAWCADLTTNLSGDVGTIEVPGERSNPTAPVQIRPGYDGRATYAAAEQFAALLTAKTAAQAETQHAIERRDAALAALDAGQRRLVQCQERLAELLTRPKAQEDVYGYLKDLDGNPIPAPRGITDAEIVAAQGQIDAAEAQIPPLEGNVATMDAALAAARSAFDAAAAALDSARATEKEPRNADGRLQSVAAAPGPFSWFFNQALLPAWEKWMPTYRVGAITELAGDTCTVALDAARSSQQDIDVNRDDVLADVPIRYMECNGEAFVVGDRVIVEFLYHDQSRPRVIGFESRPRACGDHGIIGALAGDDAPMGYSRTKVGSLYYADYKTLRFRNDAWTLGAQPSGVSVNGGRTFGQFDWVYRRDGKFKGYVTWGSPASNSNGLFFTWFQYQCPNRFGDYYSPNILPITYDGRSSADSASVFLNGRLYARPAGLIQNKECAGAAIRHVTPAATTDNPNPTERRYLLMVIDKSVLALSFDDRGDPLYPFGADLYAVDITDGPVDTNTKWAAKARLIHTIGQLTFTRPSIGNGAYGGVDRFTTYGARGVRFRFNGSATRASAVVQTVCELGYDWNGDARWHDLSEAPMVVHIDIAADLTCTHTVEEPVAGSYTFGGSRWRKKTSAMSTVPLPGQPDPPPELVGETHYTGSGSVPETTLMIDYAGDVEKRVTATNTLDYRCHQTFMTWAPPVPFDIELNHEITTRIGRHTVTELYREARPLGEISTTIWSGTKTERFQFLAVDPRYDFYAGLRMIYETTDADPTSPNLPDGARVTFELEVNGRVIQRSELPSIWWQSTTWTPIWNIGGLYNYINASINVEWAFNTANGTSSRSGAYCLRPIRRATFRVSEPFKWYLDADADPDWALKVQTTPVIDFIPYALCLTDVATGEAPKTLFVTNCPTLSATSISGKKPDGWGILAQHQWVCVMVDADGNATGLDQVFGKDESLNPRFCGAGLV